MDNDGLKLYNFLNKKINYAVKGVFRQTNRISQESYPPLSPKFRVKLLYLTTSQSSAPPSPIASCPGPESS